jgi:hypothetical protein
MPECKTHQYYSPPFGEERVTESRFWIFVQVGARNGVRPILARSSRFAQENERSFGHNMTPESDSAGEAGRVVIRSFATRDAAEMVAAQLEANGIACWIAADDCGGMLPNLAMAEGVRVLVSRSDAEEARALLDLPSPPAGFEGENEPPPENPPLTGDRPPKRFAPGQILIGVVIGFLATSFYEQAIHAPPTTYDH